LRRSITNLTRPGWAIMAAATVLALIGLASVYVTDTHYVAGNDGPINAAKQCVFIAISLLMFATIVRLGYERIAQSSYVLCGLAVVALVPLLVAKVLHADFGGLTSPRNGAYRWIHLPGFQFQPSEVFKIAYVLALAWYLRYRKNYQRFTGLCVPFALSAVPLALILLEPDLGTVLLLVPVLFSMLFLAGARKRHLVVIGLVGMAAVPLAWNSLKPYQRLRVTAVLLQSEELRHKVIEHPEKYTFLATKRQALEWAASSGYQLVHSKNAVGSGGLFGNGWGRGVYVSHELLPDRHNDFIFAIICHQWGLVGAMVVLLCYLVIVAAGLHIASATAEPFGRLLAVGVVTLVAAQTMVNICMALGMLPITGMTLPFVSYGGTSFITCMMAMALLISVSQHRPFLLADKPFEEPVDPSIRVPIWPQDKARTKAVGHSGGGGSSATLALKTP